MYGKLRTCTCRNRGVPETIFLSPSHYVTAVRLASIVWHSLNHVLDPKNILNFLLTVGKLKTTKRTGWVRKGVELPESISDHMYRMSIMSLLINDPSINRERCLKIAIVHDLAESTVGDITPHDPVTKEEKYRMEEEAMADVKKLLTGPTGEEIYDLWKEYEAGATPEAKFVKDFDKFEMILQAYEYETAQGKQLQEFFDSTKGVFKTEQVSQWAAHLQQMRGASVALRYDGTVTLSGGSTQGISQSPTPTTSMTSLLFSTFLFACGVFFSQALINRPSGIPTYAPTSTNFTGPAFIQWTLNQARGADGYITVGVQKGKYDVYTNGGALFQFYQQSNITLWLDDVVLTFRQRPTQFFVLLTYTNNISVRGLTIHFNPPETIQAFVNNITQINQNTYTVEATVCDGYNLDYVTGPKTWYVFNGKTLLPNNPFRRSFDLYIGGGAQFVTPSGRRFRISTTAAQMANNNVNVGDILATRGSGVSLYGVIYSKNASFIDVTITSSGGVAFYMEGGAGGHLLQRVKVTKNPDAPVPGDAIHVVGMQKGPTIIDSYFEGMGDDGVNLLNWFQPILKLNSSNSFTTTNPPNYWNTGDVVRLYNQQLQPLGFSQIVSMTLLPDKNTSIVLSSSHLNANYVTDRNHANANFLISNNTFYNHRARSILCKGSRGVISHNNFTLVTLGGIFIQPESGQFLEGDYATDLIIHDNYLEDIGASATGNYGGSISVNLNSATGFVPAAGAFMNISVLDNTIKGSWAYPIRVASTSNVVVSGNQLLAPFRSSYPLVTFQNNDLLVVQNNCVWGNVTGVTLSSPAVDGVQSNCTTPTTTRTQDITIPTSSPSSAIVHTIGAVGKVEMNWSTLLSVVLFTLTIY
ncbi:hypothetical protein PROFUN_03006 [Planoprotostelium fungivorum]|uniref:5'-deoxynucleotidase n=1 Tax=Planoprotostelium fungivorum TaxID=1890364 RepID=A0A2P6NXA4_9EUKA|nr:hypothetical protein PROFUN_03006 [Planoprotostelium fungivorum]